MWTMIIKGKYGCISYFVCTLEHMQRHLEGENTCVPCILVINVMYGSYAMIASIMLMGILCYLVEHLVLKYLVDEHLVFKTSCK